MTFCMLGGRLMPSPANAGGGGGCTVEIDLQVRSLAKFLLNRTSFFVSNIFLG